MVTATLPWTTTAVAALDLELAVMSDVTPTEGVAGELVYFHAAHGPVTIDVWSGPGQDLAGWRARLVNRKPRHGPETASTLCGRPALRQESAAAEETATGSYRAPSGDIGHLAHRVPPQVHVALAGTTTSGAPLLVVWSVAADARDALRGDEAHFFAALRCTR